MLTVSRFLIGSLLLLSLTSVVSAEITYSPPVRSDDGDNLGCFLQNLSGAAVEVQSDEIHPGGQRQARGG